MVAALGSDRLAARNFVPAQLLFDGLSGIATIVESQSGAETLLAGTPAFDFELSFNTSDTHLTAATELKNQMELLSAVGTVTLVEQEWSAHLQTIADFQFDVARLGWTIDANNVLNYFEAIVAQSGHQSPALTALRVQAQTALDNGRLPEHLAAIRDIHDYLLDAMPVIPVHF